MSKLDQKHRDQLPDSHFAFPKEENGGRELLDGGKVKRAGSGQ
jgi:hypothetical protein